MSSRRAAAHIVVLITLSIVIGATFLLLSTYALLGLGPQTRHTELIKVLVYVLVSTVALNVLVFVRLRRVMRLLRAWDAGEMPDDHVLQQAQRQALIFPNRLIVELAGFTVILAVVAVYVDVTFSGYEIIPVLINAALTSALLIGIGFAINIGLRVLLQPVLIRIPLPPPPTWGRFSMGLRVALILVLVVLIVVTAAGAFAYSYVIKSVDELTEQELFHRLEHIIIPTLGPTRILLSDLEAFARAEESFFVLNRMAQYVEWTPAYDLMVYEKQLLAQAEEPLLYKRDYSSFRVVAVPIDRARVLCLAFYSQAMQTRAARSALRVYSMLAGAALIFAAIIGLVMNRDLVRTLGYVTRRIDALAEQADISVFSPMSYTSLDEVGELVRAFNRIQERTAVYTDQLQSSVEAMEAADVKRQQLLDTMVGLTAPVIPVAEGVAVALLSGYFDAERAVHIRPNLLGGIAQFRTRLVIVDLTAVAEVSAPLTEQLSAAVRSVRLMGCQVVLTGVGPSLAWALSQTGGELNNLPTRRSLEEGLAYAYHRLSMNRLSMNRLSMNRLSMN